MRSGGYASNLAFNKVTGKFWRLYLNSAQPGKDSPSKAHFSHPPVDNPPNDVVNTG